MIRYRFILMLMAVTTLFSCTKEYNYEEAGTSDYKAQQMLAVGSSLFDNIARNPEMATSIIDITEKMVGYSNINDLKPLDDTAIPERGCARGEAIGLCFVAMSRQPEEFTTFKELCIRFLGQCNDNVITDEINKYSRLKAVPSLTDAILRQPELKDSLTVFANQVLGTDN